MPLDPLEGLEQRPLETQVAVLANEVRNQRNTLSDVRDELRYMKRGFYGLIFTLGAGIILYLFQAASQDPAKAVLEAIGGLL